MSENERKVKVTSPPPQVLALVLCDAIWRDPATGKAFLLGTFSVINSTAYPAAHGSMHAYVALSGGHGAAQLVLRIVDVDDEEKPLMEAGGPANFEDPRAVLEIDLEIKGVVFPKPGEYRFQLFAGEDLLLERRIVALQTGEKEDDPKPE